MKNSFVFIKTLLFLLLYSPLTLAQIYTSVGGDIPDDGASATFTINVSSLNQAFIDTTYGVESVCVNITHTWMDDLRLRLIAPDGSAVLLSQVGGDQDGYTNTCFRDDAPQSIIEGSYPYTGVFRPIDEVSLLNNQQSGIGNWTLEILDTYPFADTGSLIDWTLVFGTDVAVPMRIDSTNLPILLVNTNGQGIVDEPDRIAQLPN